MMIPDARGGLVWIHGSDGTATPVKVLVDADGHLQLDVLTVPGSTGVGNVLMGWNAAYEEYGSDADGVAGTNTQSGAAVPAGEVWVIQMMWSLNDVSSVVQQHWIVGGLGTHRLAYYAAPGANVPVIVRDVVVLGAGAFLRWKWLGCVVGDNLFWGALGYKMKVA